ncbi:MAG: hypothetical protein JOZ69_21170 [Myxococcales bacterium]|nr:hypothetical protein [Myxococcales bacterium]
MREAAARGQRLELIDDAERVAGQAVHVPAAGEHQPPPSERDPVQGAFDAGDDALAEEARARRLGRRFGCA